jgi:hypothetical protein
MLLALGVWVFVACCYLSTTNTARSMSALLQASGMTRRCISFRLAHGFQVGWLQHHSVRCAVWCAVRARSARQRSNACRHERELLQRVCFPLVLP